MRATSRRAAPPSVQRARSAALLSRVCTSSRQQQQQQHPAAALRQRRLRPRSATPRTDGASPPRPLSARGRGCKRKKNFVHGSTPARAAAERSSRVRSPPPPANVYIIVCACIRRRTDVISPLYQGRGCVVSYVYDVYVYIVQVYVTHVVHIFYDTANRVKYVTCIMLPIYVYVYILKLYTVICTYLV